MKGDNQRNFPAMLYYIPFICFIKDIVKLSVDIHHTIYAGRLTETDHRRVNSGELTTALQRECQPSTVIKFPNGAYLSNY